ncbi:MAG: ribosome small subunit-dependent GTPase A [Streptococcaceae bacterium]|jgi:ribosome biogenesis GTPase|nr:ribosome small subunit-dependent GTPase A [Streptococcaceae bacterium]
MNNYLINLGFKPFFVKQTEQFPELCPGRILTQEKNFYHVATETGEVLAQLSGRLRYQVSDLTDYPAVGDFVLLDKMSENQGTARIQRLLTRSSVLVRKAAGTSQELQVVAANVDKVFICMSLNADFNLRRAERYLALVWDSGALPVIVLTKSDLAADIEDKLSRLEQIAAGVDILQTSCISEEGILTLRDQIEAGQTIAFIGSSGVGKSSLINFLLGEEAFKTNSLRNDDKGRHTTTHRELRLLTSGGIVIDTPGMREIGLESASFSETFADIAQLAEYCRFSDCRHQREPGCAVQDAILAGELSNAHFQNYQKMLKEVGYEGLNSKQLEKFKLNEMYRAVGGLKNARKNMRSRIKDKYQR